MGQKSTAPPTKKSLIEKESSKPDNDTKMESKDNDEAKQPPKCICGKPLTLKKVGNCYETQKGVYCDICRRKISNDADEYVYHCDAGRTKNHKKGYDLCNNCIDKNPLISQLSKAMKELHEYKCQHKINENGSVTFYPTPNIKPSKAQLKTTEISLQYALQEVNCSKAAAYSNTGIQVIDVANPMCSFISAALTAWSKHYPFRFKPEHIWLLILQAIALHVDQNAEKLRDKYVKHLNKKKLIVRISANPSAQEWAATINNFAQQIDANTVKDTCELFNCDFSSSTMIEKIAAKVTIMDICKNYFSYECDTWCGFPQITIDGTKDDWIKLKEKVTKLLSDKVDKKFGEQWGAALLPLLDRFIRAFNGNIDSLFWNSMIKRGGADGSGAYEYYCGWFNILFPIIKGKWNNYCVPYSMSESYVKQGFEEYHDDEECCDSSCNHGGSSGFTRGLSSAPVKWNNNGAEIHLKFIAGFIGYIQNEKNLELCPNVGWCIAYEMSDKEKQEKQVQNDDWGDAW